MPVYKLPEEPYFPDPRLAREDGLLAVGGDLTPGRLVQAYANGIFPWYSGGEPIMWWSPDPRMVLFPKKFNRSKSLTRTVKKGIFKVTFDTDFESVIQYCSETRRTDEMGTWITEDMIEAYVQLHNMGLAHSVETWRDGKLVGGLYGVSLGSAFFGESMFHLMSDASKVAFWYLVEQAILWDFDMIDAQQDTAHLRSLGAETIDREFFLHLLHKSMEKPTKQGSWNMD